jgi:V-type H+-transporting ATPase subunit C
VPLHSKMASKFALVSLPSRASGSNDPDNVLASLRSAINQDTATVIPFQIPEFKIGTLDALVQQADELAKLDSAGAVLVSKVNESLQFILDGDEAKIEPQKVVNGSMFVPP